MQTDREDIELEQYCAQCGGDVVVSLHDGWRKVIQHVDAELEANHEVLSLTPLNERVFSCWEIEPTMVGIGPKWAIGKMGPRYIVQCDELTDVLVIVKALNHYERTAHAGK